MCLMYMVLFIQDERATFVTGMYYLKYAVGIYGWPIHLFLNPFCGICQLASHLR
jgi:hypothetical protein